MEHESGSGSTSSIRMEFSTPSSTASLEEDDLSPAHSLSSVSSTIYPQPEPTFKYPYYDSGELRRCAHLPMLMIDNAKIRPAGLFFPNKKKQAAALFFRPRHTEWRYRYLHININRGGERLTKLAEDRPRIIIPIIVLSFLLMLTPLIAVQPWSTENYESVFNRTANALTGLGPGVQIALSTLFGVLYDVIDSVKLLTGLVIAMSILLGLFYIWQKQPWIEYGWVDGAVRYRIKPQRLDAALIHTDDMGQLYVNYQRRPYLLNVKYLPVRPLLNRLVVEERPGNIAQIEPLIEGIRHFIEELDPDPHAYSVYRQLWESLAADLEDVFRGPDISLQNTAPLLKNLIGKWYELARQCPIGEVPIAYQQWHRAILRDEPDNLLDAILQIGSASYAYSHTPSITDSARIVAKELAKLLDVYCESGLMAMAAEVPIIPAEGGFSLLMQPAKLLADALKNLLPVNAAPQEPSALELAALGEAGENKPLLP